MVSCHSVESWTEQLLLEWTPATHYRQCRQLPTHPMYETLSVSRDIDQTIGNSLQTTVWCIRGFLFEMSTKPPDNSNAIFCHTQQHHIKHRQGENDLNYRPIPNNGLQLICRAITRPLQNDDLFPACWCLRLQTHEPTIQELILQFRLWYDTVLKYVEESKPYVQTSAFTWKTLEDSMRKPHKP